MSLHLTTTGKNIPATLHRKQRTGPSPLIAHLSSTLIATNPAACRSFEFNDGDLVLPHVAPSRAAGDLRLPALGRLGMHARLASEAADVRAEALRSRPFRSSHATVAIHLAHLRSNARISAAFGVGSVQFRPPPTPFGVRAVQLGRGHRGRLNP